MIDRADEMFDLFNESYASLSSFVKITDLQKEYMKKKFLNFINPEYIKFVINIDEKLIGFAVVMPSFAKALQKIKGKLFPFGVFELLKAQKAKAVNFLLIGVHPEYQNKGVHAIIFSEYHRTFTKKGIQECRRTPELADNLAIQKLWTDFNPKLIKKRCTYRKNL
jgi:GNAT superfamily N-acetyltransferase